MNFKLIRQPSAAPDDGESLVERAGNDHVALRTARGPSLRDTRAKSPLRLVRALQSDAARAEKIRTLRTELLLRHEDSDAANIFAVLSPCPSEGRSELAAELAISFAQLGQPTLLVDADLRHPTQHKLFETDNTTGLAQALSYGDRPHLRMLEDLPELQLLTAGPLPENPLELLSSRGFEALVGEWRQAFRFVVVDTPPVRGYADGLAVATIVGRVLSLSRAAHTPYRDTHNMMRRLAATRSRVLGSVISHF
jgi:receptor protein-tyrosine kinase